MPFIIGCCVGTGFCTNLPESNNEVIDAVTIDLIVSSSNVGGAIVWVEPVADDESTKSENGLSVSVFMVNDCCISGEN